MTDPEAGAGATTDVERPGVAGGDAAFTRVDWAAVDGPRRLTPALRDHLLVVGAWVGALAFDVTRPPGTPTLPWWDVTGVEWATLLVVSLLALDGVRPLLRRPRRSRRYWRRFRRNRPAVVSLAFLGLVCAVALLGPLAVRPPAIDLTAVARPPLGVGGTWAHPLGTDHRGRDLLALVVYGARVSLEVGLVSAAVAVAIGTLVGAVAAHFGGRVDALLMRYVDLQQSFPAFVLLLLLVYLFGSSLLLVVALFGLLSWEGVARIVRSETLQRRAEGYVEAASAAGASRWWVVRRHLLPNVTGTVVTAATLAVPTFILGEAALAYLGLSDPDVFSWGKVVAVGQNHLATAPWVATVPGVALFLTVLAFNFVGEGLRDATDARRSGP